MKTTSKLVATLALAAFAACGGGQKTTTPTPEPMPPAAETPSDPVAAGPSEPAAPAEPAPADLAFPEDDFRKTQPAAGPTRPLQLPSIQRFKLKNGVEVFLAEDHKLPTISAQLTFESGSINDPVGKEGLAQLCAATMGDSTETLDKIAFAEAQADMASNVFVSSGSDQQSVGFATLSRNLDATASLWAEVLQKPGFRQEDLDRNVQRTKAGLKQQKASPAGLGGLLLGSVIYGEKHPLGRFQSEASLGAVTLADCKTWHATWFKPAGARLWVVGDIDRATIEGLGDRLLAGWKGKPKASARVGKPTPRAGKLFFIDVPGAAQSQLYMVHAGPDRKAKDFFANSLVGSVLGGGFSSRINMNIREDKGYAYGARGSFSYTRYFGTFVAAASVRTDVTDKSLIEIYGEVKKMMSGEVTDAELMREKNSAVLSLPARFETAGATLAAFRSLVYFGLPLDYYASYVRNVEAVDKKAFAASAKKHLKADQLIILVIGDKATVLPTLEKLLADKAIGTGPIVILDADGKVVK